MREALIFGGGNIGRGFIGQLFVESGCTVTFVDIDPELIVRFNRDRAYKLQTVYNDEVKDYRIEPVRGLMVDDHEAVREAVARAFIAATAVGVRALEFVAPSLAAGLELRAQRQAPPLNIILCENLKNAAEIVRGMVRDRLAQHALPYLEEAVGFVDPVIGRMVPPLEPETRRQNPTFIRVEPYRELPVDKRGFRGEIPQIASMTAHDNFAVFTARKLYIHNCGHALLAYMGWLRDYEHGWQALADVQIKDFIFNGWHESKAGIVHRYGADPVWLEEHMLDLHKRFGNRALGDTIFRLGRDPVRKLGPADRLVAPARLALAAGGRPETLATGIAAAFLFNPPQDPVAVELQQRLKSEGLPHLLREICQIEPEEELGKLIQQKYNELKQQFGK